MKRYFLFSRLISEFAIKIRIFQDVENWWDLLADYLGFLKSYYIVRMTKGYELLIRGGTTDKHSIHEIILRDDYRINSLPKNVKGDVVDLGANAGIFSVHLAKVFPNVRIFAYEPINENFELLKKNIIKNHLENRIITIKKACSSKKGKCFIYIARDHRAHSIVRKLTGKRQVVDCVTLESILLKNHIQKCILLKMDVEGAEYSILSKNISIVLKKIERISMEYHVLKGKNKNQKYFINLFRKNGYKTVNIKEMSNKMGTLFVSDNAL